MTGQTTFLKLSNGIPSREVIELYIGSIRCPRDSFHEKIPISMVSAWAFKGNKKHFR